MKRKLLSLAAITSLMLGLGMPMTVAAHEDESGDDSVKTTTSAQKTKEEVEAYKAKLREKAEQKVKELQEQKTERTKEVRQKACEVIKSAAETRNDKKGEYAAKFKEKFDSVLTRIDEFKSKKNLTVENGEALEAAANDAGSNAQSEIDALVDLKPDVDCSNPDSVAAAIEAFKNQVTEVRNALKTYREAIRAYAQAVKNTAKTAEGEAN